MSKIFRLFRREWRLLGLGVGVAQAASPPALPAGVQAVAIEGDRPAFVLPADGERREVIVYLHGHCGDALAGLRSFPAAARQVGTLLSVQGDVPCRHRPGRTSWSTNAASIQKRIDAAIAAAASQLGRALDPAHLTLMGYSEGALRAELLTGAFPERYPRVVLGGSPRTPTPARLRGARAVVTLAGERDSQQTMRQGAEALDKAGIAARFWLLPRAGHGQYGPDGERVMGEAFRWLFPAP